ncbi:hypothetical protein CYY_003317 [Polysphondylium violaceum]|uniref:Transmembrane protein n=1 Tax=Polysphondylium violaceum TaxID=133409 RepID=A0A8J4PUZ0_9MYCE|nr:hypothetical protein CYY_003317 [Polysphondylium violaceum]
MKYPNLEKTKCFYSTPNDQNEIDHSKSLVILYGWMGAPRPILAKYINTWLSKGCNAFSAQTPFDPTLIVVKKKGIRLGYQIGEYIKRHPECKTILLHQFSNGGTCTFSFSIEIIHKFYPQVIPLIKGIFLDCGPSSTFKSMKHAFHSAIVNHGPKRIRPLILLKYVFSKRWNQTDRLFWLSEMKCNFIVVSNKEDDIIDYREVCQFAERIRTTKANNQVIDNSIVIEKVFEKGGHVKNLQFYKDEYESLLDKLIEIC